MKTENLLPLNTRVKHFDGGKQTHGHGTIVGYNGVVPSNEAFKRIQDVSEAAPEIRNLVAEAALSSFYDGARCPYVVHWDPSEKFPNGYKDVYEPTSISPI